MPSRRPIILIGRFSSRFSERQSPCASPGLLFAALVLTVCLNPGCASQPPATERDATTRLEPRAAAPAPATPDRPLAIVGGVPVGWDALAPRLAEAAGGLVFEEVALDILAEQELRRRGLTISEEDISYERTILLETLAGEDASPEQAERVLRAIRDERGLGRTRFEALLRRNAMLRRLVGVDIETPPSLLRLAYDLRYGPRLAGRIITVATLDDASQAIRRLEAGEAFGEVAATMSTDASAGRGGLLEPISPADPAYPAAIRESLERTPIGSHSRPVAIDTGYAILLREPWPRDGSSPPSPPPFEDVRPVLVRDARLRQERLRMASEARRLLETARITVFDPALQGAWDARRQGSR